MVLGMAGASVRPEQQVSWHTLRPGSGKLLLTLQADGPTRLIQIRDQQAPVIISAFGSLSILLI